MALPQRPAGEFREGGKIRVTVKGGQLAIE
jgi:hypothetical protein